MFRFKTEVEFIQEYGTDWCRFVNWSLSGMAYLLGTNLNPEYNIEALNTILNNDYFLLFVRGKNHYGQWCINKSMLKYNEEITSTEN